eukprot:TRINITY_DN51115_c0_g1_i1.p1 TRINITY_DN51115_c0_g1~~TRINITY_DN51115_c0_g1_i1.p1  ORF type:complete len:225 (+),score=72.83 TRINITY_DN51115_c0_g1_i1:62-676(+)
MAGLDDVTNIIDALTNLAGGLNSSSNATNATTTVTLTLPAEPPPDEYWRCAGSGCKVLGTEFHFYDPDNKLTPTEAGLVAGIIIVSILCIVLVAAAVLLLKRVTALGSLHKDLEDAKKNQYKVQRDLADADERLKAQEAALKANSRELRQINGPDAPPEGASNNPLANLPMFPLRTAVSSFEERLEILEGELTRQRKSTRESMI